MDLPLQLPLTHLQVFEGPCGLRKRSNLRKKISQVAADVTAVSAQSSAVPSLDSDIRASFTILMPLLQSLLLLQFV